jgi:hypothetical protein
LGRVPPSHPRKSALHGQRPDFLDRAGQQQYPVLSCSIPPPYQSLSKAVEMVDLSLRLYHFLHDNPKNFAALAFTFLPIFS